MSPRTMRLSSPATAVPLARLDDIFDIEGPPLSLMKIDVQGHELEVLRAPTPSYPVTGRR